MGAWGTGLYQSDGTCDLRADFKDIIRAPWDGAKLLDWFLERYPSSKDPTDDYYSEIWLALADLFWQYGIDDPRPIQVGLRVIADGTDLDANRRLGMSEQHLRQRAAVLEALAAKWAAPNPKPRSRRVLKKPQPFLLQAGDCLVYPTRDGEPYNPYISPELWARNSDGPWAPNGWGAACVLAGWYRRELFACYLVAVLRYDEPTVPQLADFPRLSIQTRLSEQFVRTERGVHVIHASRQHLTRMGVESVGALKIDTVAVAADFPADQRPMTEEPSDLCVWGARGWPDSLWVLVDDPLARYLA